MSDEGLRHLRAADPVMRELVDRLGPLDLEARRRGRPDEPFGALVRSIVGQQLSTKAARSIYERLTSLFEGAAPTPEELLAVTPGRLRAVGLSGRKVEYLCDLAERVQDGAWTWGGSPGSRTRT
jgi:DNA-3-methyladenine glycosylase II